MTTRMILTAAVLSLGLVVVTGGVGHAATGLKLKVSQKAGLSLDQQVTVSGKAPGDNGHYLVECLPTATDTSSGCDLSTEVAITVNAKGVITPVAFTVVGPSDGTCAPKKAVLACGIDLVTSGTTGPVAPGTTVTFPRYYLSLGDSYSVGYQPSPTPAATYGYTGYVAKKEKMTLVNFGCGGATSDSILTFTGRCGVDAYGPPAALNPGPIAAGQSQVTAAEAFIATHPGQIGLITVSIGGNDVTPCAAAAPGNPVNGATDAITCVSNGKALIQANVTTLVGDLSTSAGPTVPIVGLTYPDVLLGLWVFPSFPATTANQTLASESTLAFNLLINPTLAAAYTGVPNGKFVDVTAATGAYTPLTKLSNLAPYGKIPKAVAEVCKYTWYCALGNIHANDKGYKTIGKLIAAAL
ncbi:MAG TPA: SGNH/GDSL hydrolase family protein [Acidimicrobiales bacterium]|nr:SGNH/GDSL hydrolase family protein [Acidimicrobiales bacterium]HVA02193.1 SGNH/GDSL hydrolase family protein [Acidimicrobiales bacterium]